METRSVVDKRSGLIVKARMNELDMTQNQVAKEVGVSHTRLSQWMNGHDVPSDRIIRRVAEVLGLPFDPLRIRVEHERYSRASKALKQKYAEILDQT